MFNTDFMSFKETRLGKIINDVRKKTKNEDLARRAKNLLRNWQKLLEPVKAEMSKRHNGALWSPSAAAHFGVSSSAAATPSGKIGLELKNRNDFNNCSSPTVGKRRKRKWKGDQKDGLLLNAKAPKTNNFKEMLPNGTGDHSEILTDNCTNQPSDFSEPLDSARINAIPVNAVKLHPIALGCSKPSSTLTPSVLQQQARQEHAASWGHHRPRSPCGPLQIPETDVKQTVTQAKSPYSITVRPGSVDTSGLGPFNACISGLRTSGSQATDLDSQGIPSKTSHHGSCASSSSDMNSPEGVGAVRNTGKRKRQKSELDGQTVERVKNKRLTFDPITEQIKSCLHKESYQDGGESSGNKHESQCSKQSNQSPPVLLSPSQQTEWKEQSRSEIIQSYLGQQSSVLTSVGEHTPSDHIIMTEFLKTEEHQSNRVKKTHTLTPDLPGGDLPGVSREIISKDLKRLHTERWSGVNGCYDTKGNWFDWTKCISLDSHGDGNKLHILPYISLD